MNKGKETVSIVLSALLAFLLFFFFFTKLKFGLLLSMVLAVGAYIALTLYVYLFRPYWKGIGGYSEKRGIAPGTAGRRRKRL